MKRRSFRPRADVLESCTCLSGGLLDPTFNPTGPTPGTETFPTTAQAASATAIDANGRTIVVGSALGTGPAQAP